jgi:hypothetical protein
MSTRMRLVGWNVQPVLMIDDGDNLTPVNVQAIQITAANWDEFKNGGDEKALAELHEQAKSQLEQMDRPRPNGKRAAKDRVTG